MWSEIFLHEIGDDKIAIILLDTQGLFDNKTTSKNCAVIFGLSTLLSSVQIYNLSGQIQENDLQHLELFTGYGKMALEDTGNTPFQQLLFLIRDYGYSYIHEYGPDGGNEMIAEHFKKSDGQNAEIKSVRKHIKECFSKIECFLMPHPGMNVTREHFDGKLDDISNDFLENLDILVRRVLSPDHLIIKEVNGEKVRLKEMIQYLRTYFETLTSDELPKPKNIFDATAEVNHLNIFHDCKMMYMQEMSQIRIREEPLNSHEFSRNHEAIKVKIMEEVKYFGYRQEY